MTLRFNLYSVDSKQPVTQEYCSIRDLLNQFGHGEVSADKSLVSSDGIQVLKPVNDEAKNLVQAMWKTSISGVNLVSPTRLDVLRALGMTINTSRRGEDTVSQVLDHIDYRLDMDVDKGFETPMGRTFIVHANTVNDFTRLKSDLIPGTKERGEGSVVRKDVLAIADNLNGLVFITDTSSTAKSVSELMERSKSFGPTIMLDDYDDDNPDEMITISGDWATLQKVKASLESAEVITSEPNRYATYQAYHHGFCNAPENPLSASTLAFSSQHFSDRIESTYLSSKTDDNIVHAYKLNDALLRELGAPGETLYIADDRNSEARPLEFKKGDFLVIKDNEVHALDMRHYRPTTSQDYANGRIPF